MYPGGKNGAGTYQKIINQLPAHQVYIEPFLGSGAIMRLKRPALINIGADLDRGVLEWAAGLISPGTPAIYDDPAALIAAADSIKSSDDGPAYFFFCGPAAVLLACWPFRGNECCYCDPPYLAEVRRGGQRPLYGFEMMGEQDHRVLLGLLRSLPCPVALSGYESDLYNDELSEWRLYQFQAVTRGGSVATESLWMNYPAPAMLHDYQYLGENYRERERIKRRKDRWVKRLHRLDDHERQAILWAIQESGLLEDMRSDIA